MIDQLLQISKPNIAIFVFLVAIDYLLESTTDRGAMALCCRGLLSIPVTLIYFLSKEIISNHFK